MCCLRAFMAGNTSRLPGHLFREADIYPLLLPQIAFLFGIQILLIWLSFDGVFLSLIWAHCLFIFPYVMLSLARPGGALIAGILP